MSQADFEQFGKYILLEKLAAGGMAEVFLAKKMGAGGIQKFVALKRILPQYSDSKEFIRMFKDEAKIAVNLSHSNVISIHEFGVERGQFYLVMEYCEGRNLRQILNQLKKKELNLSISQIVYVIKEVAAGLDHAHRCIDGSTGKPLNITHRDMSPQNIMISFEGEIKIVDFGIAKASTQLEHTRAGTLKGKFGYMSPEQAEGQNVDFRTDIFSLGIVLWELLANDRLFVSSNEVNTLRKVRECKVPSLREINPAVPPELEEIVMKSLAKDKNLRYQTSAAFNRDLSRFLNRHDPDFSTHDFSIFIKTIFSGDILESRKRQVGYAQYQPPTFPAATGSMTAATTDDASASEFNRNAAFAEGGEISMSVSHTFGPGATETEASQQSPPPKTEKSLPDGFFLNSDTSDRPNDQEKAQPAPSAKKSEAAASNDRPRDLNFTNASIHRGIIEENQKSARDKRKKKLQTIAREETFSSVPIYVADRKRPFVRPVLLALAIAAAAYLYYSREPEAVKLTALQLCSRFFSIDTCSSLALISENTELATQTGTVEVEVQTEPPGAEVIINGQSINYKTPVKVVLPVQQPFRIKFNKTGYFSYEQDFKEPPKESIFFKLVRAQAGYLKVTVIGGGEVFINGTKTDYLGKQIPVPAGQPVRVRALDPLTRAVHEETVVVEADKVKKLILTPSLN